MNNDDKYDVILKLSEQRMNLIIARNAIEKSLTSNLKGDEMSIQFVTRDSFTKCVINNDDVLNKVKLVLEEEIKEVEKDMHKFLKLDI